MRSWRRVFSMVVIAIVAGLVWTATATAQKQFQISPNGSSDGFGSALSISGDYAIVGADETSENGKDSGSAFIFKRSGENWTQTAKLIASDAQANAGFGYSVSISADYAIVGSLPIAKDGHVQSPAYIFARTGTDWTEQSKLVASDAAELDFFGLKVSISGDYAVVGATGGDEGANGTGSSYLFRRSSDDSDNDVWSQSSKLLANDITQLTGF